MVEKVLNATLMKSWGEREGRSYASNGTMRAPGVNFINFNRAFFVQKCFAQLFFTYSLDLLM